MKHKTYKRLGLEQRYQISCLRNQGLSQTAIAAEIGVHKSTISRELKDKIAKRGRTANIYDPERAQKKANDAKKMKGRRGDFTDTMLQYMRKHLVEDKWSPEIISECGKMELGHFVSVETIYKYLYTAKHSNHRNLKEDKDLHKYLKHDKRRQKRNNSNKNRGCIPDRVGIEERPKVIKKRKRLGDVEVDIMMGANHKPALIVMTDRCTRETDLIKITTKKASSIAQKIITRLKKRTEIKTLTFDNDLAFAQHKKIAEALQIKTYFTRPYSSQDKGSVENRIGQIRRWFPKGTSLFDVHIQTIASVQRKLNNRPFRMFGYYTALEMKNKLLN